jgi:hypothetical protein
VLDLAGKTMPELIEMHQENEDAIRFMEFYSRNTSSSTTADAIMVIGEKRLAIRDQLRQRMCELHQEEQIRQAYTHAREYLDRNRPE